MKKYMRAEVNNVHFKQSKGGNSRLLNFEILRILCMFMVLSVHYNINTNGSPNYIMLSENTLKACAVLELESLNIVCVNVFILISGYFGIKWKLKSFCALIYQLAFWAVLTYVLTWCFGFHSFDANILMHRLLGCITANWFYLSYIGLYILAPLINAFIESNDTKKIGLFLIVFYIYAFLFGYISKYAMEFAEGMSFVSLSGLYITGAYLKKTDQNGVISRQ